jgi:hypothetical protein
MKMNIIKLFCTAAIAGLVFSCTTIRVKSWKSPDVSERPIGKTMVLAIAPNTELCRKYESLFLSRFGEVGVEALSLADLGEPYEKLEKEKLVALLQNNDFDSILVTRVMALGDQQEVGPFNNLPPSYGTYSDFYFEVYVDPYLMGRDQIFMEYHLETNLYDVPSQKLVWTGRNVIYDNRSDNDNLSGIIRSVIRDLERKDLLQEK